MLLTKPLYDLIYDWKYKSMFIIILELGCLYLCQNHISLIIKWRCHKPDIQFKSISSFTQLDSNKTESSPLTLTVLGRGGVWGVLLFFPFKATWWWCGLQHCVQILCSSGPCFSAPSYLPNMESGPARSRIRITSLQPYRDDPGQNNPNPGRHHLGHSSLGYWE